MRKIDNDYKNALLRAQGCDFLNDDFVIEDDEVIESQPLTELEKTIYQKNPQTGFPDNDLMVMSDGNVSPQLRLAIQNRNRVISPNAPSSFDDDVLLDEQQTPFESSEEYYERLNDEVQDFVQSQKMED